MSESKDGRFRVDYSVGGKSETRLWEPVGGCILESTFDADGRILGQRLLQGRPSGASSASESFVASLAPESVLRAEFEEVSLGRGCPKCGRTGLRRYIEEHASSGLPPVMPLYTCRSCGTKSYLLTDEYMDRLVTDNRGLFTDAELRELAERRETFMAELRGYIIRIFASKKILSIS